MYKIENGDFGNLIPVTSEEHRIIVMVREKLIENGIPVHELYKYAFDGKKQNQLKRLRYKKERVKQIKEAALNAFIIAQTEIVHLYVIKNDAIPQMSVKEFITNVIKSDSDTVFFEIVNGQIELAEPNNFDLINVNLLVPPSFQNVYDLIDSGVNVSLVTSEAVKFTSLVNEFRKSYHGKLSKKMFVDFSEIEVGLESIRIEETAYSSKNFDAEMLMNLIVSQHDLIAHSKSEEAVRNETEKLQGTKSFLSKFLGASYLLGNLNEFKNKSNMVVHHVHLYHLAMHELFNKNEDIPDEVIEEIESLKQAINLTNEDMIIALDKVLGYSFGNKIADIYSRMNLLIQLETKISISEKSFEELQANISMLDKLDTDIEKLVGTIALCGYYNGHVTKLYQNIEDLYFTAVDEIAQYINGDLDANKTGNLIRYIDDRNNEDLGDLLMELQDDLIEKLLYFKHRQLFEVRI